MTAKRKAELQRKLAIAPVPKPPADLAERIKGEIPRHLLIDAEKDRFRLRQSVAFNVRVAASILLLVSSVYLALHLLSRKFGPEPAMTASKPTTETASAAPVVLPATPPSPESMQARAKEQQERKQIIVAEARRAPIATRPEPARQSERDEAVGSAGAVGGLANAAPPAAIAAPLPLPPPPAPAPAPAVTDSIVVTAEAPAITPRKSAAETITVTPSFDVEAAVAPFDASKQILRVSLDGARATPDVAFNDDTVASWHTVTSDGTSLYEITLRPQTRAGDVIATARVNDMERVIRRGDLRSWNDASRRMKIAILAAALDAGVAPRDVAAKARAAGLDDLAAAAEARGRKKP